MRLLGVPVWSIVLVACVVVPFVIRVWVEAEQRRTKERTLALLKELCPEFEPGRRKSSAGAAPAGESAKGEGTTPGTDGDRLSKRVS